MALERWYKFQQTLEPQPQNNTTPRHTTKVEDWFNKIDEYNAYPINEISNVDDILNKLLNKSIDYEDVSTSNIQPKPKIKRVITPKFSTKRADPIKSIQSRHEEVKQRAQMRIQKERQIKLEQLALKNAAAEKRKEEYEAQKLRIEMLRAGQEKENSEMIKMRRREYNEKRMDRIYGKRREKVDKHVKYDEESVQNKSTEASVQNEKILVPKSTYFRPKKLTPQNSNYQQIQRKKLETKIFKLFENRRKILKLSLLRKCFTTWVYFTVNQNIQIGKIKALIQYKSTFNYFNIWYKSSLNSSALKFTQNYKNEIKQNVNACKHYENVLLSKIVKCWRNVTQYSILKIKHENEKNETKKKIDNVLENLLKPKIVKPKSPNKTCAKPEKFHLNLSILSNDSDISSHPKSIKIRPTKTADKQMLVQQRRVINEQKRMIQVLQKQNLISKNDKHIEKLESKQASICSPKSISNQSIKSSKRPSSSNFYKIMEQRSKDRNDRINKLKQERLEREKIKAENEILAAEKAKIEAEKLKTEQAIEKKKQIQKQREKVKNDKILKLKFQNDLKRAEKFYLTNLKRRVVRKFKNVVRIGVRNENKAEKFYIGILMKRAVNGWKFVVAESENEKFEQMREYYEYSLMSRCLKIWKDEPHRNHLIQCQADRHYNFKLKKVVIKSWLNYNEDVQKTKFRQNHQADEFYKHWLIKRHFHYWKTNIQDLNNEKEKRARVENLYKKVALLLPDFKY